MRRRTPTSDNGGMTDPRRRSTMAAGDVVAGLRDGDDNAQLQPTRGLARQPSRGSQNGGSKKQWISRTADNAARTSNEPQRQCGGTTTTRRQRRIKDQISSGGASNAARRQQRARMLARRRRQGAR
ncbi:hypothetical protein Scep_004412 [Stephania cephalantha]|uniref:Uncharacterized protein n=1 Tax=Stephania cephalantha TaxID=152367 RepID=A0AAP0PVE5_9MAGN